MMNTKDLNRIDEASNIIEILCDKVLLLERKIIIFYIIIYSIIGLFICWLFVWPYLKSYLIYS
jgi:hypothetical protein